MRSRTGGPTQTVPANAGVRHLDDVVLLAQRGDVAAFEQIYRAHAPAVMALCRRMCGDEATARSLVQDVFVRAWEKLATFRGQSSLATWLHRVAVNLALNHLRSIRHDSLELLDRTDESALAREPDGQLETRIDVDWAVAQLPTGARAVFVLHDIHGYSHDEIAQMTGIAAGTARAQLWRARRALTKLLDR